MIGPGRGCCANFVTWIATEQKWRKASQPVARVNYTDITVLPSLFPDAARQLRLTPAISSGSCCESQRGASISQTRERFEYFFRDKCFGIFGTLKVRL